MRVTKRFEFSYAHCLPNHNGKCKRLHGHNAILEVTVGGEVQKTTSIGHSTEGMTVDFGDLKDVVNKAVIDKWDHYTLAKGDEPFYQAFESYDSKGVPNFPRLLDQVVVVGERTTAENLARLAYNMIRDEMSSRWADRASITEVKFYETPSSWVSYP